MPVKVYSSSWAVEAISPERVWPGVIGVTWAGGVEAPDAVTPAAAPAAGSAANEPSPVSPTSRMQSSSSGATRTPAAWQTVWALVRAEADKDATVASAEGMARLVNVAVLSPGP